MRRKHGDEVTDESGHDLPRKAKADAYIIGAGRRLAQTSDAKKEDPPPMRATWKPHTEHGELTKRSDLPSSVFAFPKLRKEPMTDAKHVRNAIARFDQVTDVSEEQRSLAFTNIKKAAKHYGVDMSESSKEELGSKPSTGRTKADRERSARKGAKTRKRKKAAASKKKRR